MSSVVTVQFIVHSKGSHPPGRRTESSNVPLWVDNRVDPNTRTRYPMCRGSSLRRLVATLPVPMAPIMLSPPPIDTGTPAGRPSSAATSPSRDPTDSLWTRTSGRHSLQIAIRDRSPSASSRTSVRSRRIEETCSRCVARFHATFAGQVKIHDSRAAAVCSPHLFVLDRDGMSRNQRTFDAV